MKNAVLELFAQFAGWQVASIHDARRHFVVSTKAEQDRFCNMVFNHGTANLTLTELKLFGEFTAMRAGTFDPARHGTCLVS